MAVYDTVHFTVRRARGGYVIESSVTGNQAYRCEDNLLIAVDANLEQLAKDHLMESIQLLDTEVPGDDDTHL